MDQVHQHEYIPTKIMTAKNELTSLCHGQGVFTYPCTVKADAVGVQLEAAQVGQVNQQRGDTAHA